MSERAAASRRAFLVGAGGVAAGALLSGGVGARVDTPPARRSLSAAVAKGVVQSGSDQALVPPFEIRVLNRMGFGPARRVAGSVPGEDAGLIFASGFEPPTSEFHGEDDVAHFLSLGSDDDERLSNYVEEQLAPADIDDSALDARLAEHPASFDELNRSLASAFSRLECTGFQNYSRPLRQVERAAFTRAVYSRRQLLELMADFWHNHFNVFGAGDSDIYVSWASWDRDVIRRHAFGNFYQMAYASARHPAMLRYLDNYENRAGGINENYARELFELHTLGAENYAGVARPRDVESLAENPYTALNDAELNDPALGFLGDPTLSIARYYVDDDVYSAAEALTGWRYHDDNSDTSCGTGGFLTNPNEHSGNIAKAVMTGGVAAIPSDMEAEQEGRLVIKLAAYHPGTATHIARKLCRRLISDTPPESVVQAAAQTFYDNRRSPRQIERTLRTILLSDEFKDPAGWGQKLKRPFEYAVSAMRAAGCDYTWRDDDRTSSDFLWMYRQAGQQLFAWRTPDGYPDRRSHWEGTTTLVHCWRMVDWLLDRNAGDRDRVMQVIDITLDNLPGSPTPRALVEFWCHWVLGFTPAGGWAGPPGSLYTAAPTQLGSAALQFMTQQGFGGDSDRSVWPADEPIARDELGADSWPYDWHNRLRGLVALILWSPQFMQR